jgi:membrane fusion protein (multidrug efflux system)
LSRLAAEEAAGRIAEAGAALQFASDELSRIEKLKAGGLVPDRDLARARTDVAQRRATLAIAEVSARRVLQEQTARDRERDARIEGLQASIASQEADHGALQAGVDRLSYDIARRTVRASIDGIVAEAATLRPGEMVTEGSRLGSIIPIGRLLIAAQFPATAALGRIRPGQHATLRLDGFPWTEFGIVGATVARVAQETREGQIRVELTIDSTSAFRGLLEHGMPGSLDVAVEQVTPLALLWRTAGRILTARR